METAVARAPLSSVVSVDDRRQSEAMHDRSTAHIDPHPKHAVQPPSTSAVPYNHGLMSLAHLANAASKEFGTPPDSRRASGEEKDLIASRSTGQSLPSISEALGIDKAPSRYVATTQSAPHVAKTSYAPASPIATMRSYVAEPSQTHSEMYAHPAPTQTYSSAYAHPPHDTTRAGMRPAVHTQVAPSAAYSPASVTGYQHSPVHDRPPPFSAQSSVPTGFPYGYQPYPPRYAASGAQNESTAPSAYQTPAMNRAAWESETSTSPRYKMFEKTYGESVKRHLDLYDLESALNEIASTSNFLGDFSRRYGDLLHQSPRSGLSLAALPSQSEVEDMISKSRTQTEALIKISETVHARHAALDVDKADARHVKPYEDYDDSHDDESKGPDAKKRRGRAAPPGRCHSCNRAETPEWRRGPDGARTLCNACGLHYAKLTRKQNTAGKSAVGTSNLRPKDGM